MLSAFFESVKESFTVHAEESQEVAEVNDGGAPEEAKEEEGETKQAEEEEEEEEEPEDLAPAIREECEAKKCHSFRHHYEECASRVASGKTLLEGENCVEELFHLMHCVDDCAASKVFATLK